jgi:hypothetical protein
MSVIPRQLQRVALLVTLAAAPLATAHAQRDSTATVRGTVRTAEGVPIDEVLLVLSVDTARIAEARTLGNGGFSLPRVLPGHYTLAVRRIGYESRTLPVVVTSAGVTRFDVTLAPLAVPIDAASASERWTGVVGVVGEYTTMQPIGGVRLQPLTSDRDSVQTDAQGRFSIALPEGGTGVLRAERQGYQPRLVSFKVLPGERTELAVLLDSGRTQRNDAWVWKDLAQRHRWSTPRSVRVSRSELLATGAQNLLVALEQSPSVQESNLIFTRGACLYVNGQPRPGFPLDAIVADRVEYVEAYALRGDLSRTLETRWPQGASCGAPGGDLAIRRAIESGLGIQYVVVWLR